MRRLLIACVVALVAGVVVSLAAGGSERVAAGSRARTYVHYPNGKLVGWVEKYSEWDASLICNSYVSGPTKSGGYYIYEGDSVVNSAFPRPPGQRRRYTTYGSLPEVFLRITSTRWNIYRRGRMIAFTRGPHGVPAALAFATWGDKILPD